MEKNKSNWTFEFKKQPLKCHENILVFYKNQCTYNPQDIIKLDAPIIRKGTNNGDNYIKSNKDSITEFYNYPISIINVSSEGKTFHPTQKPVALMEYLIKTYTNEGQTVLDNCMGSGTTGVACINTKRNFIGIEQESNYFDISVSRISATIDDQKPDLTLEFS